MLWVSCHTLSARLLSETCLNFSSTHIAQETDHAQIKIRLDVVLDVSCPEVAFTALDLRRWQEAFEEAADRDMQKRTSC